MKLLIYIFLCLFSFSAIAQKHPQSSLEFVRIYNLDHKKIGKGIICGVDETNLYVKRNSKVFKYPFKELGEIKTKRSFGRHVLLGLGSGAVLMGIANASAYDEESISGPQSRGDAAIGGAFIGIAIGSIVGGISHLFMPIKQYTINGDLNLWNTFKASYPSINPKQLIH